MQLNTLLIALAFAIFAVSTPVNPVVQTVHYGDERHLTQGVPTRAEEGRPYIRREIHDLKDNYPESWSLYLLGLLAFQQMDQDDPLSYYRIAGIHGRPHVPWQDAKGAEHPGGEGYCPHNNVLFGTWHRPYVALFEQELYKQVRKIADQATSNHELWNAAADAFRVPYWDWNLGEKGGELPDFFTTPMITVAGPDEIRQTITNPLYQYEFHPVSTQDFAGDWTQLNSTLRCPASHAPNVQSQNQLVRDGFLGQRRGWLDGVANILSNEPYYNSFSATLELIHGGPHYVIGCNEPAGHMWVFEYSAFEPMFMLVHANIDRLIALYQVVRPNTWVEPSPSAGNGNFWIPNGITLDADMQMQPFWKDSQSFYTSNDVRNTSVFGYAYPETQYWNYGSDVEWRAAVNASIALQYSPSSRDILAPNGVQSGSSLTHLLKDNTFTDWTIKTKASSLDMPPTFRVEFSLVDLSSLGKTTDLGMWLQQTPGSHGTGKMMQRSSSTEKTMEHTISLTSSLLDQIKSSGLKSLDTRDVVPYLKGRLTWRVISGIDDHNRDEPHDSLTVEVVSTQVRIPNDPKRALEYSGETTSHPEVTQKEI